MSRIMRGLIAGAAGTAAINASTYLDMAVRGRPPSTTPRQSARKLADLAGVDLGGGQRAEHRESGLGPLLGYLTGLGAAAVYTLTSGDRLPRPAAALSLATMATAGSLVPMAALGITDPRRWSAEAWAADLVPHLIYGIVTAETLRRLR